MIFAWRFSRGFFLKSIRSSLLLFELDQALVGVIGHGALEHDLIPPPNRVAYHQGEGPNKHRRLDFSKHLVYYPR